MNFLFSFFLLLLLSATTVVAQISCLEPEPSKRPQKVASTASCDIALQKLAKFLLPCLWKETVTIGKGGADFYLPLVFGDKSPDHPAGEPRCGILFDWRPKEDVPRPATGYDIMPPGKLQAVASSIRNQCIAASPAAYGEGWIEPNQLVHVSLEGFYGDGSGAGNWSVLGSNGTLGAIDGLSINPVSRCGRSALLGSVGGVDAYRETS